MFVLLASWAGCAFPSSDNYGNLAKLVDPAPSAADVVTDTELIIQFDSAPKLGSSGTVVVYDSSDAVVDTIKLTGESNTYGDRKLSVGNQLIAIDGTKVRIIPHSGVLKDGRHEYYVAIETGVITGTLNGVSFNGFSRATKSWRFTTRASVSPSASGVKVAKSGSADFRRIQSALNWAAGQSSAVTIQVGSGTYHENLDWHGSPSLTIVGSSASVRFENYDGLNSGTSGRALFLITGGHVRLEKLEIENTHVKSGTGDQAEVLYFNSGSGTFQAVSCRFLSRQDTIQVHGYSWFYDCFITGDVDFVWGANVLALFEACEINARKDNRDAGTVSYTLQARTVRDSPGFVYLDCDFTVESGRTGTAYIARTNGAGSASSDGWDCAGVIKCRFATGYSSQFWYDGGKTIYPSKGTATRGFREYGSMDLSGKALSTSGRNAANYIMTKAEFNSHYKDRATIVSGTPLASLVGNGKSYAE